MERPDTLFIRLANGLIIQTNSKRQPKFASIKASLLVAWLGYYPGIHRRERIATMLWDNRSQQRALGNLRTLIARMPQEIKPFLNATPQTIAINPDKSIQLDLHEFERLVETGKEVQAEALFRGDILAGVNVEQSEELIAWTTVLREEYTQKRLILLEGLVRKSELNSQRQQAIIYAQRLVNLNPLREASYRVLMRLLALDGRRNEALECYERCQAMLRAEFLLEPEEETIRIARRVSKGDTKRDNLPAQITSIVGRTNELAQLKELLIDGQSRLVTIVSIGGMGKTSLAIEFGNQAKDYFLDGIIFVSLIDVTEPDGVISKIVAELVAFGALPSKPASQSPSTHFKMHIAAQQCLLIIDNFDDLVAAAAQIASILEQSPNVKILITSRQRLAIDWEYPMKLSGLEYASGDEVKVAELPAATQLFLQRAQPFIVDQILDEEAAAVINEICQLVGGQPLAVEIAAKWSRVHSFEEILNGIREGAAFLDDPEKSNTGRHKSIQAVFAYAWQRFSKQEQFLLSGLSILEGAFDLKTAQGIMAVDSHALFSLTENSFLRRIMIDSTPGQTLFTWHPLVRDFVVRQKYLSPDEIIAIEHKHCTYFLALLKSDVYPEKSDYQVIKDNSKNVMVAWNNAIRLKRGAPLAAAASALANYWRRHGSSQEAVTTLKRTITAFAANDLQDLCLNLRLELILFLRDMSLYAEAIAEIQVALQENGKGKQDDWIFAQLHIIRGEILGYQSQFELAEAELVLAGAIALAASYEWGIAEAERLRGHFAYVQGDLQRAEQHCSQAYVLFSEQGNSYKLARTENNLGLIYFGLGRHQLGFERLQSAVEAWRAVGEEQAASLGELNLGAFCLRTGRFAEALQYLSTALKTARQNGNQRRAATANYAMGSTYVALGQFSLARAYLQEAIVVFRQHSLLSEQAAHQNLQARMHIFKGQATIARIYASESLTLAQSIGNQNIAAVAYTYLGYAYFLEENWEQAEAAFLDAETIQTQLNGTVALAETKAALAVMALHSGSMQQARQLALPFAAYVKESNLSLWRRPFAVIYNLVTALAPTEPTLAAQILTDGLSLLEKWEGNAPSAESRVTFRNNVADHQQLFQLAARSLRLGE